MMLLMARHGLVAVHAHIPAQYNPQGARLSSLSTHTLCTSTHMLPPPPAVSHLLLPPAGMLNLVQAALGAAGISYVRLDGSTPAKSRADMIRAFASKAPSSPTVFLVGGLPRPAPSPPLPLRHPRHASSRAVGGRGYAAG